jgi:hypothetical protein
LAFERFRDTGVQRASPLAQQRAIGCVLHQGRLKQICRVWRHALPERVVVRQSGGALHLVGVLWGAEITQPRVRLGRQPFQKRGATALRLGTAETDAILRRFTRNNVQHPTYKSLAELGALRFLWLSNNA